MLCSRRRRRARRPAAGGGARACRAARRRGRARGCAGGAGRRARGRAGRGRAAADAAPSGALAAPGPPGAPARPWRTVLALQRSAVCLSCCCRAAPACAVACGPRMSDGQQAMPPASAPAASGCTVRGPCGGPASSALCTHRRDQGAAGAAGRALKQPCRRWVRACCASSSWRGMPAARAWGRMLSGASTPRGTADADARSARRGRKRTWTPCSRWPWPRCAS
jgi:hypothetical protein